MGHAITHWTVRIALIAMTLGALILVSKRPSKGRNRLFRWVWTIGCVAFICHVIAAFHFYHHWSHTEAFQVTAERTYQMLGFSFGHGIYFSYVFTVLWFADVLLLWVNELAYWGAFRSRGIALGYLGFIAFNGAVVFEAGITRPLGIVAVFLLLTVFFLSKRRSAEKVAGRSERSEPSRNQWSAETLEEKEA